MQEHNGQATEQCIRRNTLCGGGLESLGVTCGRYGCYVLWWVRGGQGCSGVLGATGDRRLGSGSVLVEYTVGLCSVR